MKELLKIPQALVKYQDIYKKEILKSSAVTPPSNAMSVVVIG